MAALPPPINARGDIHLELENSCNCCCWGKAPFDVGSPVYINSRGNAELWRQDKADADALAARRAVRHLEDKIDRVSAEVDLDPIHVRRRVEREAHVRFAAHRQIPLTVEQISRINSVLREIRMEVAN